MRLALCLVAWLALTLPAWAGSVDCVERSLGALCRNSQAIALVKVTSEGEARVRLEPVKRLAGEEISTLSVDLDLEGSPSADARGLAFLRREESGAWVCLDLILLAKPEDVDALSAAVAARLGPKSKRVEALFAELLSASPRLRRDAAIDLVTALRVGLTCRKLTDSEQKLLIHALGERPSLELLVLCRELRAPQLAPALLSLSEGAPHPAVQAALAKALAACDRKRALEVWGAALTKKSPGVERLLGYLGGREAGQLLSKALEVERGRVRRLALLCALADCRSVRAAVLAQVARQPLHPGEDHLALAALARSSEGRVLRDLHQALPAGFAKDLAHALRRDPVELALRVQRAAEEELIRLTQPPEETPLEPAEVAPQEPAEPKSAEAGPGE